MKTPLTMSRNLFDELTEGFQALTSARADAIIKVTDEEFGRFMEICEDDTRKPSPRILTAAKRLDTDGL